MAEEKPEVTAAPSSDVPPDVSIWFDPVEGKLDLTVNLAMEDEDVQRALAIAADIVEKGGHRPKATE
jgi:hypothetical protein